MLCIPPHILFNTGKSYQWLAAQYLPDHDTPQVNSLQLPQYLMPQPGAVVNNEKFYFIADVKSGTLSSCNGIYNCLGYADAYFTHKNYLSIIHPAHAVVQGFYAKALFHLFTVRQVATPVMQPISATTLALKNKNGKYVYCKRLCYPIQLTNDGRITAYLCKFLVIKDFFNEDYYTSLYNSEGQTLDINDKLRQSVRKLFEEIPGFSVQELRILRRYAQDETTTSEVVAKAFKIERNTINTFNKRIIQKAEKYFGQRFSNAKAAAAYFKRMQMI